MPGADHESYYRIVRGHFDNPDVADTIRRVCMDGSNRQPKFILPSMRKALAAGGSIQGLALLSALWCRYCYGETDNGRHIAPNDPNWDSLAQLAGKARQRPEAWLEMTAVYGDLGRNEMFASAFVGQLQQLWAAGTRKALECYLSHA